MKVLLPVKALLSLVTVCGASDMFVQTISAPLGIVTEAGWNEYLLFFSTILICTVCTGADVLAVVGACVGAVVAVGALGCAAAVLVVPPQAPSRSVSAAPHTRIAHHHRPYRVLRIRCVKRNLL